jgi:hypothetical protein
MPIAPKHLSFSPTTLMLTGSSQQNGRGTDFLLPLLLWPRIHSCDCRSTWRVFTGDQIGALLGSWQLEQARRAGVDVRKIAMLASTVSSKMLRTMAEVEGFHFVETLTGFKYVLLV